MTFPRTLAALFLVSFALACGGKPDPDPFEQLDQQVTSAMEVMHLPAVAACAARGERILFCRSYGDADIETGREVTEHTPFLLASITKTVTAVATMSLVERGLLELDDHVADRVDFKLGHPHGDALTLRHLLAHTGAIADSPALGLTFYTIGTDPVIPLGDVARGYFEEGGAYYDAELNFLDHAPGTTWAYSNLGYALLGRIGELAAKDDFREVCRDAVLDPLEMADSSMRLAELDPDQMAVPYSWDGESYLSWGQYTFADYPNGGLFASAHDLVRFAAAVGDPELLEARGVLDRASREEMLRPHVVAPEREGRQALGFVHTEVAGEAMYGHDGSELGVMTSMRIRERDGMAVVLLTNNGQKQDVAPIQALIETLFETASALD